MHNSNFLFLSLSTSRSLASCSHSFVFGIYFSSVFVLIQNDNEWIDLFMRTKRNKSKSTTLFRHEYEHFFLGCKQPSRKKKLRQLRENCNNHTNEHRICMAFVIVTVACCICSLFQIQWNISFCKANIKKHHPLNVKKMFPYYEIDYTLSSK